MRILWAGIGPGHATGYGIMTREFTRRFRGAGHEVVLTLFGEPTLNPDGSPNRNGTLNHPDHMSIRDGGTWDGMRALGPASQWKRDKDSGKWQAAGEFRLPGQSFIWDAFGGHNPDLVIVLKDAWVLDPADYRDYNTAVWLVFDTEPLGAPDRSFFARSGARAVCASTAGQSMASEWLQNPLYVPHGIDTGIWTPGPREAARELLGLPGEAFIAGICAANIGPRKAWGEQLAAFAEFHASHPGSLLLIHAVKDHPEGMDIGALAEHLGIRDAVKFPAHTAMDDPQMVNWTRSLDVLMAASYGEGFGLPIVQAQACGIPVIGTDCSAISEKIPRGTGWLVQGQRWWNPHHQAWWTIPAVEGIVSALHRAAKRSHSAPEAIRAHALAYDAGHVMKEHWEPVLDELAGRH